MKAFTELYTALDETTKTNAKTEALVTYLHHAPPEDAVWAIWFLSGRRLKLVVPTRRLCEWSAREAGISDWLFDESYLAVGDLAETIALLLPDPAECVEIPLHQLVLELGKWRTMGEEQQRAEVLRAWRQLDRKQRFVLNKLITGEFRVGVSQQMVIRALARQSGIDAGVIAHRLMGNWEPDPEFYQQLLHPDREDADISKPYPFFLASQLDDDPATLGDVKEWLAEWKWDGIRSQLIRRNGKTFLWSRGEELITERFPELQTLGDFLPDGAVIDGEVLPWKDEKPMSFSQLQQRIGRKLVTSKILADVPVTIVAYDLLEFASEDIRQRPLVERRSLLAGIVNAAPEEQKRLVHLSPVVVGETWEMLRELRATSRERGVEGLMLKRLSSPYRVGRQRGDWWKWKIEPYTVDAVLIYAQRGHGRRASLYTDYTFGVWERNALVPFAKAYSGLSDEEIDEVDRFVRQNTVESFGPVRSVKPELVFELAFEGLQRSTRHKSGIATRFPRILRWRKDKKIEEADTLETIKAMLKG
ncbi:MAG: ATP-dependent DNA ligase [Blastocatellia bacterium]|nr:ATP-dependent DNA ligase [Blastocatellia bacterium]